MIMYTTKLNKFKNFVLLKFKGAVRIKMRSAYLPSPDEMRRGERWYDNMVLKQFFFFHFMTCSLKLYLTKIKAFLKIGENVFNFSDCLR